MLLGLRTAIYHTPDITEGKLWYTRVLGAAPYFDQPFYVGFNINGYELGLHPDQDAPGRGGGLAYWRVADIDRAVEHFVAAGATLTAAVQDVGDGIKVAAVDDPFGNKIGLIENPHFKLPKE